jgi:hypothetical protein
VLVLGLLSPSSLQADGVKDGATNGVSCNPDLDPDCAGREHSGVPNAKAGPRDSESDNLPG